jgi:hypothetical protein
VGSGEEGPSAALSSTVASLSQEIASQVTLLNHPSAIRGRGKRNIVEIFDSEEAVRVVPREAAVDLLPK